MIDLDYVLQNNVLVEVLREYGTVTESTKISYSDFGDNAPFESDPYIEFVLKSDLQRPVIRTLGWSMIAVLGLWNGPNTVEYVLSRDQWSIFDSRFEYLTQDPDGTLKLHESEPSKGSAGWLSENKVELPVVFSVNLSKHRMFTRKDLRSDTELYK